MLSLMFGVHKDEIKLKIKLLTYSMAALEELWLPSNESLFSWLNFSYLLPTRGRVMGDKSITSGAN